MKFIIWLLLCSTIGIGAYTVGGNRWDAWRESRALSAEIQALGLRTDPRLQRDASRTARRIAGQALGTTIRLSRNQSRLGGTRPVPQWVEEELGPHFPTLDFAEVRWTPSDGRLSLGTALTRWYMREGAVVLDDVIVFSTTATARDRRLWAHELTHVMQYRELGVDGFAHAYVGGFAEIERQAERNAQRIIAELREAN